jgi:uncharacterized protein YciI
MSEKRHYVVKLLAPRPTFMMDMSDAERATMQEHLAYWMKLLDEGHAIVFGPVADPKEPYGLGILVANDDAELARLLAKDPAVTSGHGLRHEVAPMLRAVVKT